MLRKQLRGVEVVVLVMLLVIDSYFHLSTGVSGEAKLTDSDSPS